MRCRIHHEQLSGKSAIMHKCPKLKMDLAEARNRTKPHLYRVTQTTVKKLKAVTELTTFSEK